MPNNGTGERVSDMEDNTPAKSLDGHVVPRRRFAPEKEKPSRSRVYLELLAHYDAGLVQTDGSILVVRCKTGAALPLEQRGKRQMVTLLLDEFGTVDGANEAIENYKVSRS